MTTDTMPTGIDIEAMAREASGIGDAHELTGDAIGRFAAFVLDEAATICEGRAGMRGTGAWVALTAAADAIRSEAAKLKG